MASIQRIIRERKGTAGSSRSWSVVKINEGVNVLGEHVSQYILYHYSTPMLIWGDIRRSENGSVRSSYMYSHSIGHGSVSDQNGMNTAFQELRIPCRYHRDWRGGGPRIHYTERYIGYGASRVDNNCIIERGRYSIDKSGVGARLEDILDKEIFDNVQKIIERGKKCE